MAIIDEGRVVVQGLSPQWYGGRVGSVAMLRLDLLHPVISGNKWFKLRYNLLRAIGEGHRTVLSFGGAHSNHLIALAAAAGHIGLRSIGAVRGEYARDQLTDTLRTCEHYGMRLHFVSRADYARRQDTAFLQALSQQFAGVFIVPEGGANEEGIRGAQDIAAFVPAASTHLCVSVGSGTTFVGLRQALSARQALLGFVPLRGGRYLTEGIAKQLTQENNENWELFDKWHLGGFGKCDSTLISFMNDFYTVNGIPLDRVYTAKMMFGLRELIYSGAFPPDSKILAIHTGGLQGNSSVAQQLVF